MSLLQSIRKWIDGESGEDALEAADEQSRPRRIWEEFLVKIAREVEAVMQREMFTPPGGPTYIPREYVIYLSNDDDKEWQGDKRRGLEEGLFHVLSERAQELSGANKLAAKSFAVELRVDGTLSKGEFRVQAVWDETENQTSVTPRIDPNQTLGASGTSASAFDPRGSDGATGSLEAGTDVVDPNDTLGDITEGEQTVVRSRPTILYQIEVWRDGLRDTVVPIMKPEITIGRGSRSIAVDLPIKGDPEVSRVHATLMRSADGRYWLVAKGRNPTLINGHEIPRGENIEVAPDQKISICNFVLRIQPG